MFIFLPSNRIIALLSGCLLLVACSGSNLAGFGVHRCAMPMEGDLVATTSRVFYIDDSSSLLEKTDIRGAMMLKYMLKLPEVTACNMRADQALAGDD